MDISQQYQLAHGDVVIAIQDGRIDGTEYKAGSIGKVSRRGDGPIEVRVSGDVLGSPDWRKWELLQICVSCKGKFAASLLSPCEVCRSTTERLCVNCRSQWVCKRRVVPTFRQRRKREKGIDVAKVEGQQCH